MSFLPDHSQENNRVPNIPVRALSKSLSLQRDNLLDSRGQALIIRMTCWLLPRFHMASRPPTLSASLIRRFWSPMKMIRGDVLEWCAGLGRNCWPWLFWSTEITTLVPPAGGGHSMEENIKEMNKGKYVTFAAIPVCIGMAIYDLSGEIRASIFQCLGFHTSAPKTRSAKQDMSLPSGLELLLTPGCLPRACAPSREDLLLWR